MEKYSIRIKNISKDSLKGVSVKTSGLQEDLFETEPTLTGFSSWDYAYNSKQNISALICDLVDNSQRVIRLQKSLASDFF